MNMFPTDNTTSSSDGNNHSDQKTIYNSFVIAERMAIPCICFLGLVGNTVSFLTFLQKPLRQKSCSLFLAVRSLSDNGFLLTLLIVWISSAFDLRLSRMTVICQSIVFLSYVFGCLSVWLVVFVTIENYIRICKPVMVKRICKASNARNAVVILVACVLCCYNFPLWTLTSVCQPDVRYYTFINIMVYLDTLLTLLLPTIIMTLLMSQITMTEITARRFRRQLSLQSRKKMGSTTVTKVTAMLLAVTLTFFILNMPSHVIRIRAMILALVNDTARGTNSLYLAMRTVSQLLYYLSLAINVIVYYVCGSTFRKAFYRIFQWKTMESKRQDSFRNSMKSRKNVKVCQNTSRNSDSLNCPLTNI